MGRQKKENPKNQFVAVRFTEGQRKLIGNVADARYKSVADYIFDCVRLDMRAHGRDDFPLL